MFQINDPVLMVEVSNMLKCVRERGVRECLGITDDVVDKLLNGDEKVINELRGRSKMLTRIDDEFKRRAGMSFFKLLAEVDRKIKDVNVPKERARIALCTLVKALGGADADCGKIPTELFDAFQCVEYKDGEIHVDTNCLDEVSNSGEAGRVAAQIVAQMAVFYSLAKGQLSMVG